jgi:hypothetical protein
MEGEHPYRLGVVSVGSVGLGLLVRFEPFTIFL